MGEIYLAEQKAKNPTAKTVPSSKESLSTTVIHTHNFAVPERDSGILTQASKVCRREQLKFKKRGDFSFLFDFWTLSTNVYSRQVLIYKSQGTDLLCKGLLLSFVT